MHWMLLVLVSATLVAADEGDDIYNNLFSDLSPLLALFGERVTMQFMSQAVSWADNLMLAMAPLGIITIIVSAIRVGGPFWLKAIIGRGTENLPAAEAELMSSTSEEVCELWNGREIVRCMGSAPVVELICLLPKGNGPGNSRSISNIDVINLDNALNSGYLREIDPKRKDKSNRVNEHATGSTEECSSQAATEHLSQRCNSDLEKGHSASQTAKQSPQMMVQTPESEGGPSKTSKDKSTTITIIQGLQHGSPNISLNAHRPASTKELRFFAAIGVFLQLGVLVYSGFATYVLRFPKNDQAVLTYAYPCAAVGTLLLVFGLTLCAHVVESSTKEQRFEVLGGREARLLWLQRRKTVSDQVFDSCAIYPKNIQPVITTSRRLHGQTINNDRKPGTGRSSTFKTVVEMILILCRSLFSKVTEDEAVRALEAKTTIGTLVTLCGFFTQFVGLRGLHWSASLAQLIAVIIMMCLRAVVRRSYADPPESEPLPLDFELDWFAKTLGRPCDQDWKSGRHISEEGRDDYKWVIISGGDTALEEGDTMSSSSGSFSAVDGHTKAHVDADSILKARKEVGGQTQWSSHVSAEAICLTKAIEATMGALCKTSILKDSTSGDSASKDSFRWCLGVEYNGPATQTVVFALRREATSWRISATEIEAALSLWLSSVQEEEKQANFSQSKNEDGWLRATGPSGRLGLHVLGPNKPILLQDLRWWIPKDLCWISSVRPVETSRAQAEEDDWPEEEDDLYEKEGDLKVENQRIVGFYEKTRNKTSGYSNFKTRGQHSVSGDKVQSKREKGTLLAAESYRPLPLLYAQYMFSAFMHALAKMLQKQNNPDLFGVADTQPEDTSAFNSWQSLSLRNAKLSSLLKTIESTGLGSLEEAYLCVIPALSKARVLPRPDAAIIELARKHAEPHERLGRWKETSDIYLWLFQKADYYGDEDLLTKATAVLFESLRQLTIYLKSRNGLDKESDSTQLELQTEMNKFWGVVTLGDPNYTLKEQKYNTAMKEYSRKAIDSEVDLQRLLEVKGILEGTLEKRAQPKTLRCLLTLYNKVGCNWNCDIRLPKEESDNQESSILAAPFNSIDVDELLSKMESARTHLSREDVDARDIHHRTPLHYAAVMDFIPAKNLLRKQADVNARDLFGWTAMHYACHFHKLPVLKELIQQGADINAQGRDGTTPLHCAARMGNKEAVRDLIAAGANANIRDLSGNTPLLWAAYNGHEREVEILWTQTNKILRDSGGRSALHLAAAGGRLKAVRWILKRIIRMKAAKEVREEAEDDDEEEEEEEVSIEAEDHWRRTPLHWAAQAGHKAVVKLLIEYGANKEATCPEELNRRPLHLAVEHAHEAVVTTLLKLGVEKDAQDRRGDTALHIAVIHGQREIAIRLIDDGAKVGRITQEVIREHGSEKIAKLLIDYISPRIIKYKEAVVVAGKSADFDWYLPELGLNDIDVSSLIPPDSCLGNN